MADNVPITAGSGTSIAADDIGSVWYQRVKVNFGADGSATDVSTAAPLPVYGPDVTATGTITATDAVVAAPAGAGALVTGASTAGSIVAAQCLGGDTAWNVQVTGLTTGTLYFETSLDSTNGTNGSWIAVNGRRTGIVNTVLGYSLTSVNGVWRGNTSGSTWFRVRSVGGFTGTPAIVIRVSDGIGAIFLNASIPAGTNLIGTIGKAPAGTGTITSPALSAASFTILAANTARLGATVYNDSVNLLYLGLASTTSTTSYTVQVPAGGYYELPSDACGYTGIITGISAVASGNCRVTELTV